MTDKPKPDQTAAQSTQTTQAPGPPPPSITANIAFNAFQGGSGFSTSEPPVNSNDVVDDKMGIFKVNAISSKSDNSTIISLNKPYYGYSLVDSKTMKVKDAGKKLGSLSVILSSTLSNGTVPAYTPGSADSAASATQKTPDDEIQYTYIRVPFVHGKSIPDPDDPKNSKIREKLIKMHTFAVFDDSIFDPKNKISAGKLIKIEFLDQNYSFAKITALSGKGSAPAAVPGFFFPNNPIGSFAGPIISANAGVRTGKNGIMLGASTAGILAGVVGSEPFSNNSKLYSVKGSPCPGGPAECGPEAGVTTRTGSGLRFLLKTLKTLKGDAKLSQMFADSYFIFIMTGANDNYSTEELMPEFAKLLISALGNERYFFILRGSLTSGVAGHNLEKQNQYYTTLFNELKAARAKYVAVSSVILRGDENSVHSPSNSAYKEMAEQIKGIMTGQAITL